MISLAEHGWNQPRLLDKKIKNRPRGKFCGDALLVLSRETSTVRARSLEMRESS